MRTKLESAPLAGYLMKLAGVVIVASFCLYSCGSGSKNNAAPKAFEIKKPEIPAVFTTGQQRAEYVAVHYWDGLDFSDTTALSHDDVLEQAFVDYIALLQAMPSDLSGRSVRDMLGKAQVEPAMFDRFTRLYERYLYEPNSPMRNEELYIPVLEFIVNSDKLDEYEKLRPQSQLEMALKNRPRQKATDISIRTGNGSKTTLHGVKAEYTILYINNPDCSACAEVTAQLVASPVITQLFADGTLKIFAVYPDEDITAWRNHLPKMPAAWINGYDESLDMRGNETYDLKAIPSLYLLDRDKNVLLKDAASVVPLEQYFIGNKIVE